MRVHQMSTGALAAAHAAALLALAPAQAPGAAAALPPPTEWNESPDPDGLYGYCEPGGSALGAKSGQVYGVGETLAQVIAIKVLSCRPYTGGGPTFKVPCPRGTPYAYCVANDNDGIGNDIYFGILKADATTDPNAPYAGCPAGARLKPKLDIVRLAGRDPTRINGIVTLSCRAAVAPGSASVAVADCPAGPHPYAYCLRASNDGAGNDVTVGVVGANGPGDPHALYGECNTQFAAYGIQPGFRPKTSLVTAVGRSIRSLRSIDLMGCNARSGWGPAMPAKLEARSCVYLSSIGWMNPLLARRYDYCIWGVDARGNAVLAGVNKR
ncbi:hypothetical protein [Azohydromonas caseinilytica]|uniref:Uncharacterized protein n=1 Tax=Azohydromonas caseinilytica TaxID=2728836 RepID=A0A848FH79_9BURK|nr:hypothetical protein [Azohydromonas caseinilytica]NML18195.1 hypothetical protein [Azohydromonas caseinilytica]